MALYTLQPTSVICTSTGLSTSSPTYSAGDILGNELTISMAAASTGGRGVITAINVQNSSTNSTGGLDMRIFSAASSATNDNAANSWTDANSRLQLMAIQVAAPVASALNSTSYNWNLWMPFTTTTSPNLFLDVITLGTPIVFAAVTDLQYTFEILQWV